MGLTRYMSVLMDDAMKQARFFDHEFVMPEHMLLALLRQYAFCQALQEEGVDSLKMHEDLVGWLAKQERVPNTVKYLPEPSSLFKTMFGTACALAAAADRQLVNVPHFVQAMFGLQNSEAAFLLCKNVGDRQGEFLASVDSYYPIGEDTGEAGMGMGADFDDDDYANDYDDTIMRTIEELLPKTDAGRIKLRLLGVTVSGFYGEHIPSGAMYQPEFEFMKTLPFRKW